MSYSKDFWELVVFIWMFVGAILIAFLPVILIAYLWCVIV